jgi:hypothetical protein
MIVVRVMVTVGARFETTPDNARSEPPPPCCAATTYVIGTGQTAAVSAVSVRNAQHGKKAKPLCDNDIGCGPARALLLSVNPPTEQADEHRVPHWLCCFAVRLHCPFNSRLGGDMHVKSCCATRMSRVSWLDLVMHHSWAGNASRRWRPDDDKS